MDKKITLIAAAAGIMLATGAPALAQGDPGEGIARGVMHGIEGGDRHRDHDRRHREYHDRDYHRHRHHDWDHDRDYHRHRHTGIATVATSTSMTTTSAKSEWASLNSLNFETIAFGTVT